jgi:Putative transposase of IS4/5 family (DUF4096)
MRKGEPTPPAIALPTRSGRPLRLPVAANRGQSRTTALRVVVNAIFYIEQSGCQWRMLPKDFPRFTTAAQRYFDPRRDNACERFILPVFAFIWVFCGYNFFADTDRQLATILSDNAEGRTPGAARPPVSRYRSLPSRGHASRV